MMEANSIVAALKPGDCVNVYGHRFNDILLVESHESEPSHKFSGTLLSTGETVRLLILKNHSGTLHLRRSNGEVIHPDALTLPLPEAEVLGWVLDQQRRLNQAVSAAQAYAAAFRRNSNSFQKKMNALK